ncbi:MAG: hypothetical protein R3A11_02700 [Bdellovibrionota bacterium]
MGKATIILGIYLAIGGISQIAPASTESEFKSIFAESESCQRAFGNPYRVDHCMMRANLGDWTYEIDPDHALLSLKERTGLAILISFHDRTISTHCPMDNDHCIGIDSKLSFDEIKNETEDLKAIYDGSYDPWVPMLNKLWIFGQAVRHVRDVQVNFKNRYEPKISTTIESAYVQNVSACTSNLLNLLNPEQD